MGGGWHKEESFSYYTVLYGYVLNWLSGIPSRLLSEPGLGSVQPDKRLLRAEERLLNDGHRPLQPGLQLRL